MDWTSAPIIEDAPLEPAHRRFLSAWISAVSGRHEAFLERERAQLPLWFAAAFGAGIAAWLWLPGPRRWTAFSIAALGVAVTGLAAKGHRLALALLLGGFAMAAGCMLIWWRSDWVESPRLGQPKVASFVARVETVETLAAKDDLRLTLIQHAPDLPPRIRLSVPEADAPAGLASGAELK